MDLKGDLARAVVARAPDPDRLIYVAPHRALPHQHYWSFNPLAFDRADRARFEFYANALPVIFERIGGYDPEQMQRIRKVLSSAVRLALAGRDACFGDVYFILHDPRFREELLSRPHVHPYAWDFWKNEFAGDEPARPARRDRLDRLPGAGDSGSDLPQLRPQPAGIDAADHRVAGRRATWW